MRDLTGAQILITGGAGFVGLHLARALAARGAARVVLLDNLQRGRRDQDLEAALALGNMELMQGDLTDQALYPRLGQGYDQVYHLAAVIGVEHVLKRPALVVRTNALSTLYLLDWLAAGGGHRVLFSSTSEAYAWTRTVMELPVPTPEDVPLALTDIATPRSSYAGSKIFGELAVTHLCRAAGLPYAIVRYHNVYGPRMGYVHVIPQVYQRARSGQNPLVVYSPDHRRAFCHIDDAVWCTMAALEEAPTEGLTVNIGNPEAEVTIGELARLILEVGGIQATLEPRPNPDDPIGRRSPDVSRAREILGYQPRVDLRAGLADTLAWYREHPGEE